MLEDDLLPKKICATCFLKIESIDKFAFSAAKNQECFTSWLENKNKAKGDVAQTTIETSTNSDFSFSNITIKKEFNHRQQIVFQPQKQRNPRHVDHITLEQIINDQIIKNPKLPASTTITKIDEPKRQRQPSHKSDSGANNISIVSYHNLQIGQLIKDSELLKLILRALKWEEFDRKASYPELIERLRRSNCRDILTNKNLLSDNDVVQLLRSYVNDSMLMNLKVGNGQPSAPHQNISKLFQSQPVLLISPPIQKENECAMKSVVDGSESMEVSVDPGMFLADEESITIEDDEETVSAAEAKIETAKLKILQDESERAEVESNEILNSGRFICTSCPEVFALNSELQDHVVTHLITSTSSASSTKPAASAIVKPLKRKRGKEEKLRSRRKRIVIRINPSPKRNLREKAKFVCAICNKSLSSKRNLHFHHDTHKEPNGKFRCDGDGCKKLFGKLENFVKHRQEVHSTRRKKNQNEK